MEAGKQCSASAKLKLKVITTKRNPSYGSVTLTHWGRDKMDAISQTTFWNAFSLMKIYEFGLRFHWILFLSFELAISQHWFG